MGVSVLHLPWWPQTSYWILSLYYFAPLSVAIPLNNSPAAITNSGDAWAGLVANIAPLLVLLGEKHVKAYFKSMSRQSHSLLYAISPIGLITAVVTLIRLCGSPLMKRIIGRQFETRAEVLADVTSVSYGEVGLRFQKDRRTIEQAMSPPPEDETYFAIYLKDTFSGASLKQNMQDRFNIFGAFDDVTRINDERRIEWYSINVIKVQGCDARIRSQRLAWHKTKIESRNIMSRLFEVDDLQEGQISDSTVDSLCSPSSIESIFSKGQCLDECTISNATYLEGPGVSPVLTSTESLDGSTFALPNKQNMRYCATLICATLNIVIIAASGILGDSVITLTLISVGVLGAFLGSLMTANFIRRSAKLTYLSMIGSTVICAGFFSNDDLEGIGLTYSPSTIVISTASDGPSTAWASSLTVLLSTMAFISLYLGLRAAAWWVPLTMLANLGLAAFLRAMLGREMNVKEVQSEKASVFSKFRRKAVLDYLVIEQILTPTTSATSIQNNNIDDYNEGKVLTFANSSASDSDSGGWTIISAAGMAKAHPCEYIPPERGVSGADRVVKTLLYNAFNIAYILYASGFMPRDSRLASLHQGNFLQSEFLGDTAIWRQPLELLLPFSYVDSDLILDDPRLARLLRIWVTEAFVGDHVFTKGEPYSLPRWPIEPNKSVFSSPFVKEEPIDEEAGILLLQRTIRETAQALAAGQNPLTNSWAIIWSNKTMLWMAIKIIFASRPSSLDLVEFGRILQARRNNLVPITFPQGDVSRMDPEYLVIHYPSLQGSVHMNMEKLVPWYIDCLVKGGLVTSIDNPLLFTASPAYEFKQDRSTIGNSFIDDI